MHSHVICIFCGEITELAMFPKRFVFVDSFHMHSHVICIFCGEITELAMFFLILPMIIIDVLLHIFFITKKLPTFRTRMLAFYLLFFFTEITFNNLQMMFKLVCLHFFPTVRTTNHPFSVVLPIYMLFDIRWFMMSIWTVRTFMKFTCYHVSFANHMFF